MRFRHDDGGDGGTPTNADTTALTAAAAALSGSDPDTTHSNNPDLLRELLDALPAGVALLDAELRWWYLNTAFATVTGLRRADLLGRPAPDTAFADAVGTLRRVLDDGRDRERVTGGPDGPGAPVPVGLRVRYRPLTAGGRVIGVIVAVLDDPEPVQELRRELVRARTRLALLEAAAERIGTTLDIDTTGAELAAFAVPRLAELATVDVLPPDTAARPGGAPGLRFHRAGLAAVPALRPDVGALARPGESVRHREGSVAARALASGVAVLLAPRDAEELTAAAPDPHTAAVFRTAGVTSLLVLPLTARGELVGLLTLARTAASPASARTTRCWSATSPPGPRPASTTPAATAAPRASRSTSSAPCSANRATRTRTSNSPPATCRPAAARWSAATGTRPSGCRSAGPCWSWAT